MDKSSVLNQSLFYFTNQGKKVDVEIVPIFTLFCSYQFLNDQTVVLSGIYSGKTRNFLKEIRSIYCFSSSKSKRPYHCCNTITLKIIINSASDLPEETALLKYMD